MIAGVRPRRALFAFLSLMVAAAAVLALRPGASDARGKAPRSYTVTGEIRSISDGGHKALIKHQAIPGYMMAMTMEFNVRDPAELKGIGPGDTVRFRLVPTKDTHWIDQIVQIGKVRGATPGTPPPPPTGSRPPDGTAPRAELKVGDPLPDVELLAEDGKRIHVADFRGKALAFTFIFTRCPLPDYCPRMSNYFAAARKILVEDKSAPANWQLLSISFDPAHDTPLVLRNHARMLRSDNPDRWLFAAAPAESLRELSPRLDLMVKPDGQSFQHNLRTVVLDPRGRIHKQLDGNEWTPKELAAAIAEAARIPPR